ncbi:MAG TPA: glucosyl-3-phosphoglycerate synthase [Solirubrobacteraceae bacterium]|jgi:glucosyl-3-phosphoglycerate synthase|nr:glucosyl-3-phosphoglycerate synthase [Solirubrobacteraceae bacterium]
MPSQVAERWLSERTFRHDRFPAERLARERDASVSVCLPARECAETIGPIVRAMQGLRREGVVDQIVVVDAASADGTAVLALQAGAEVHQESELLPEFGPARGKGDAMWRALSVLHGDVVAYVDADSEGFAPHFVCGLLGPLLCAEPGGERVQFVKGCYRRPFTAGGISLPDGGGRVNHLAARPALALFYPELAGVRQPLAGEVAAHRSLLERVPFTTGYGVETAMLIDVWREVGLEGMAQVDLGVRHNRHQTLHALSPMAYAVLLVIAERLERDGRLSGLDAAPLLTADGDQTPVELEERPPMASVPA